MVREEFAFRKGWSQLKLRDTKECRERIMKALNITTKVGFCQRMRGGVEPKVSQARALEEIFKSYGITDIWGMA